MGGKKVGEEVKRRSALFQARTPPLVLVRPLQTGWFNMPLLGRAPRAIRLINSVGLVTWLSKSDSMVVAVSSFFF